MIVIVITIVAEEMFPIFITIPIWYTIEPIYTFFTEVAPMRLCNVIMVHPVLIIAFTRAAETQGTYNVVGSVWINHVLAFFTTLLKNNLKRSKN